jgi:PPOX class probable F420-dependent enzyme
LHSSRLRLGGEPMAGSRGPAIIAGMFSSARALDRSRTLRGAARQASEVVPDVEALLRSERTIWLSTVAPDGAPHLVPIWFTWDGAAVWIFSKPHAVKVRNMRRNGRVMLAIGQPLDDFDVQLIEGCATLLDEPTAAVLPEAHRRRYAAALRDVGLTWDEYSATYSQAIRIEPTRFLPWRGRSHLARADEKCRRPGLLARLFALRPALSA